MHADPHAPLSSRPQPYFEFWDGSRYVPFEPAIQRHIQRHYYSKRAMVQSEAEKAEENRLREIVYCRSRRKQLQFQHNASLYVIESFDRIEFGLAVQRNLRTGFCRHVRVGPRLGGVGVEEKTESEQAHAHGAVPTDGSSGAVEGLPKVTDPPSADTRFEYFGDDGEWREFEETQQEELRALHQLRPIPRRFFFSTSSNVYIMDNFQLVDSSLLRESSKLMGCGTVQLNVHSLRSRPVRCITPKLADGLSKVAAPPEEIVVVDNIDCSTFGTPEGPKAIPFLNTGLKRTSSSVFSRARVLLSKIRLGPRSQPTTPETSFAKPRHSLDSLVTSAPEGEGQLRVPFFSYKTSQGKVAYDERVQKELRKQYLLPRDRRPSTVIFRVGGRKYRLEGFNQCEAGGCRQVSEGTGHSRQVYVGFSPAPTAREALYGLPSSSPKGNVIENPLLRALEEEHLDPHGLIRWLEANRLTPTAAAESASMREGAKNPVVSVPHSTFGVVRLPDCLDLMPQTSQDSLPQVEVEDVTIRPRGFAQFVRSAREAHEGDPDAPYSVDDINCRVCEKDLEEADDCLELNLCHHKFHRLCLSRWFGEKGRRDCPRCELPYGQKRGFVATGSQPKTGLLSWTTETPSPGDPHGPETGVIVMRIELKTKSRDFLLEAFLPDTEEGRLLLAMTTVAFRRCVLYDLTPLGNLEERIPLIKTREEVGVPYKLGRLTMALAENGITPEDTVEKEVSSEDCASGPQAVSPRRERTTFGDLVQSSSLLSKLGIWFLEAGTRGKSRTKLKDLPLPTPIQRMSYTAIGGEDQNHVSMVSPPGTGKTLAYLLPVIDRIVRVSEGLSIRRDKEGRAVRSDQQKTVVRSAGKGSPLLVVVVPTRELAEQAHTEVKKYCPPWMAVQLCAGGTGRDVRDSHVMALSHGADVVVGTPGRLKWLADHGALSLTKPVARPEIIASPISKASGDERASRSLAEGLQKKPRPLSPCIVLDEADVLLTSEVVLDLVRELARGRQAQMVYASATFDAWMKDRLRELSPEYHILNATEEMEAQVVYALREVSHLFARLSSNAERRVRQLTWAIEKLRPGASTDIQVANKVLIYCREKTEVCILADDPQLRNVCAPGRMMALHADMSPAQRKEVMDSFRTALADYGPVVLITTDIAARGLDISGIGLVIHYGAPKTTASYIHRVGRIRPETVKRVSRAGDDKCKSIMFLTSGRALLPPPRIAAQWGMLPAQVPTDKDIKIEKVRAMVKGILEAMQEQSEDGSTDAEAWKTANSLLYGVDDPDITQSAAAVQNLAAALHLVALRQSPPSARSRPSLLSGRKGYSPILLLDPYLKKVPSKDRAAKLVSEAIKEAASHGLLEPLTEPVDSSTGKLPSRPEKRMSPLGRIALTRRGYAVDIPTHYIRSVLGSKKLRSAGVIPIYLTTQVPRLITDERTFRLRVASRDRRAGVQEVTRVKRLRERITDCLEKSRTLAKKRS
ncbi:putative ATP-dependent RNA helicase ddx43 [Perkinsus olseni]|uniref:ATP-dependent RNA helicase n=1 Tax=Perkinsus olseni TaxID=32597 RepID=A0A7J6MVR4_PEROL|nr:putative ATP-dependent RNA helicase ddx43 [Perkinsus olseni]